MLGTDVDTRRLQSYVDPVRAVITLCRRVISGLHVERVVGAGLRAGFAADTAAAIEIDNSVLSRKQRRHGTDFHARSVGAVIAAHYRKQPPRIRKSSFLDILDPSSIYADRNFMFGFTGDSTRVAADALSVIDYEAEIHREFLK